MSEREPLPSISVVIPTFNGALRLERVLPPLLDDPGVCEIVIAVDGSEDDTFDLLERAARKDARVRPLFLRRGGASAARQRGVEEATSDVVLLLDDDIIVTEGLVSGHARHHLRGTNRVVLGYTPTVLPEKRAQGQLATFLYARDYDFAFAAFDADSSLVLRRLWGANVSIRRDACLRVGLSVETYRERYHEDRDFGLRCLRAGMVGIFDRSLLAHHLHVRSLKGFLADARSQGAGLALAHTRHSTVLGELDREVFAADVPRVVAFGIRAARIARVEHAMVWLLVPLLRLAGRLRLWSLETAIAQFLRRIEQQRGAIQQLSGLRA